MCLIFFRLPNLIAFQADEKGPEFAEKFAKTKLKLRAAVATLQITAHLETLLGLMTFVDTLKPKRYVTLSHTMRLKS